MNLNPWEVVFIQDKNEISHAIRYYKVPIVVGNEQKERTKVEWYDSTNIYFSLRMRMVNLLQIKKIIKL